MTGAIPLAVCVAAGCAGLFLLRHQLRMLGRFAARSAVGLGMLWLFNLAASFAGMHVGLNLFTGAAVGVLGLPGFALLLLLQCI